MLQGGEVVIILIVALIFLGPSRLPEIARKAGAYAAELRKAAREVRQGLEAEVADLKSAGTEIRRVRDDLRKPIDQVKDRVKRPLDDLKGEIDEVGVSRLEWKGPKPVSGPTPEDAMSDLDEIEGRNSTPDETGDNDAEQEGPDRGEVAGDGRD